MKPLVVCITGPTATGKTDAAVTVCQALGGEVLSMDSMQVYTGMDIGTAKPSVAEMGGVPHHLLSCVPPDTAYSVAAYQQDARAAMSRILQRRKLPVFAGGTGLYLQAVSRPLTFATATGDTEVRKALEAELAAPDGAHQLHARLAAVDPETACRLHPNNTRRVVRALEVYLTTGQPMSAQSGEWEGESDEDWLIFALSWPREVLYRRIDARVDRMLSAGLVEEVRQLLAGGIPPQAQSMQAIGYKEIVAALDGICAMDEATEAIKRNTRRYAKRQITWLRRDPRVQWVDLSSFGDTAAVHSALIKMIEAYGEKRQNGHN